MSRPMLYDFNDGAHPDEARVAFIRDDAPIADTDGEDFAAYEGREGIWRGRWVMVEVADEDGADVTDQDGGNHSVSWGELDLIGGAA